MKDYVETHKLFASKIGSAQIATQKALKIISKYAVRLERKYPNGVVLEIGSGIGTIAHLIISVTKLNYLAYETNDFCLKQLQDNIKSDRLTCLSHPSFLLANLNLEKVKFLIIDDFIAKNDLEILLSRIKPKYIFIEGHRFQTRRDVVGILKDKLRSLFIIRLFIFSPNSKKGGLMINMLYPSSIFSKNVAEFVTLLSWMRFYFVNINRVYRILRFLRIYTYNSVIRIGRLLKK